MVQASGWRAHHGEENSPLKNTAPSSFTALSTSDNTSIGILASENDSRLSEPDARINAPQA
jgi:hypothetical protein